MRRVVVGLDPSGRSTVVTDDVPAAVFRFAGSHAEVDPHDRHAPRQAWDDTCARPGDRELVVAELWATGAQATSPAPGDRDDPTGALTDFQVERPAGGTLWRLVIMGPNRFANVHRTDTLDYDVILSGAIDLLLDTGEVRLVAGDSLVLPGLSHGWRAGPDGCTMAVCQVALART